MNKTFIALALTLSLGVTACRTTKDEPQPKPNTDQTTPTPPNEEPAKPEPKIVIEGGILKSYPEEKTPADGTVTLEASVTEIGEGAFASNTKLKTLVAPGLKKIASRAFAGATALHLVDLSSYKPESEHPYPETAADAFVGTPADKVVKLPAKPSYTAWFEFIALHTFGAIEGLQPNLPKDAVIKDGELQSLPARYKSDAVGLLVLPNEVTKIAEGFLAQDQNNGRTGVKLIYGTAVKEIGNGAFSESYIQFAHFPQVTKLGMAVFGGLSGVKALSFPQLTEIGDLCFYPASSPNKSSLYFLSLPALKTVGRGSFAGTLTALKTLVLGAMPTVNKNAFDAKELDDIEGEWVPFISGKKVSFEGGRAQGATLLVPTTHRATYSGDSWEGFTIQEIK